MRTDRDADEIMGEVLRALKERHIGLAKDACGALESAIGGNPENVALLEELQGGNSIGKLKSQLTFQIFFWRSQVWRLFFSLMAPPWC